MQAIQTLKANAAAASKVNNVKPEASTEFKKPKPELPAESKSQMGPPQARPHSGLPSNFFDKPDTKRQQNGKSSLHSECLSVLVLCG